MVLGLLSCKGKDEKISASEEETSFFPVVSFLKSQVADVDTSLYQIIKIEKRDTIADTTYLRREEFRSCAKDFTTIPDISSGDLKEDYTETKLYDESLKRAVLSYSPKERANEIQRQEVTIEPDREGGKVKTIFIHRLTTAGDSTVEKKMFWQVGRRFQINTTVYGSNQPEQTHSLEVVWGTQPPAK